MNYSRRFFVGHGESVEALDYSWCFFGIHLEPMRALIDSWAFISPRSSRQDKAQLPLGREAAWEFLPVLGAALGACWALAGSFAG